LPLQWCQPFCPKVLPFPFSWDEVKVDELRKHVKMTCMKMLPKMDISEELNAQINESIKISDLSQPDVIRQAPRIGLPQFAARFQSAPLWLGERIREALAQPAEPLTPSQFKKNMKAIADGAVSHSLAG
jgi:hypothetical protein